MASVSPQTSVESSTSRKTVSRSNQPLPSRSSLPLLDSTSPNHKSNNAENNNVGILEASNEEVGRLRKELKEKQDKIYG